MLRFTLLSLCATTLRALSVALPPFRARLLWWSSWFHGAAWRPTMSALIDRLEQDNIDRARKVPAAAHDLMPEKSKGGPDAR
jgi:hypothetical protein